MNIIFTPTKYSNIYFSIKDNNLIILFLYEKENDKDNLKSLAKKIYQELKFFSAEKIFYLDNIFVDKKNALVFKYNFKHSCGILPAVELLKLEEFFNQNEE